MRMFMTYVVLVSVFTKIAVSEGDLQQQNQIEYLNPVNDDTQHPSKEQGKRTVFSNHHGWAKHVGIHPAGFKYVIGYGPVDLKYVPVVKPITIRTHHHHHRHKFHIKPVALRPLLPVRPVIHHTGWKPVIPVVRPVVPVNVPAPPHVPHKPWQQQGWISAKPVVPVPIKPVVPVPVKPVQHVPVPVRPVVVPIQPVVPVKPVHHVPVPVAKPLPAPVFTVVPQVPLAPAGVFVPQYHHHHHVVPEPQVPQVVQEVPHHHHHVVQELPHHHHQVVQELPLPHHHHHVIQELPHHHHQVVQELPLPHHHRHVVPELPLPQHHHLVPVNQVPIPEPALPHHHHIVPHHHHAIPLNPQPPHEQHDVQTPLIPQDHPLFQQQLPEHVHNFLQQVAPHQHPQPDAFHHDIYHQHPQQVPVDQQLPQNAPTLFNQHLPDNVQHFFNQQIQHGDSASSSILLQGSIQPGQTDLQIPVHLPQHPTYLPDGGRQFQPGNFHDPSQHPDIVRPSGGLEPPFTHK